MRRCIRTVTRRVATAALPASVAAPLRSNTTTWVSMAQFSTTSVRFERQHDTPFADSEYANEPYTIFNYPARALFERPAEVDLEELRSGSLNELIAKLRAARKFYQYPGLSAPQIGWNQRVFTMHDGRVFINPEIDVPGREHERLQDLAQARALPSGRGKPSTATDGFLLEGRTAETAGEASELDEKAQEENPTCWCWEACASCSAMLHYIPRPSHLILRGYDENGEPIKVKLDGMDARIVFHEMDHMEGIDFTRRIPTNEHVVPIDAFTSMSDWPDDYPSIEARSTMLFNIFTAPMSLKGYGLPDAALFDRIVEDRVFPGCKIWGEMQQELGEAEVTRQDRATRDRLRKFRAQQDGDAAEGLPEALDEEELEAKDDADEDDHPTFRK